MKKPMCSPISLFISLCAVQLLISCAPSSGPQGQNSPVGRGVPPISDGTEGTPKGPHEGGGGTGVGNKVFESYKVDVEALPAYQKYVFPLFANQQGAKESLSMSGLLKMKSWYVAPVELVSLDKESLGVAFFKSTTQQIALQTMSEIWIDKKVFDEMSEKDQGDLILHEMIMMVYMLRFVSFEELCRLNAMGPQPSGQVNCEEVRLYDEIRPPEPPRPLNQQDNEKIRAVTGWLLENGKEPYQETELKAVMLAMGFDERFLQESEDEDQDLSEESLEVNYSQVSEAFEAGRITGHNPNLCIDQKSGTQEPCEFIFRRGRVQGPPVAGGDFSLPSFEIEVKHQGVSITKLSGAMGEKFEVFPIQFMGQKLYMMGLANPFYQPKVGESLWSGIALIAVDPKHSHKLTIRSLILRRGVIVSVGNRGNIKTCDLRTPISEKAYDVSYILTHEDAAKDLPIETLMKMTESPLTCEFMGNYGLRNSCARQGESFDVTGVSAEVPCQDVSGFQEKGETQKPRRIKSAVRSSGTSRLILAT